MNFINILLVERSIQDVNKLTLSIHDILNQISDQTAQIESFSAQIQELGASATEIANSASKSFQSAEQAGEMVTKGVAHLSLVGESLTPVDEAIRHTLESVKDIESVVNVIAEVADQTNLLGLNARIEAARAGDAGRGFSVVASEVQKLADSTRDSIKEIRQKMGALSKRSMDASEKFNSLKSGLQESIKSVQLITAHLDILRSNIELMASTSEQQSAALEESASVISETALAAVTMREISNELGKEVFDHASTLIKLRSDTSQFSELDQSDLLETYKTDHILWVQRVFNLIMGYNSFESVGTHHECRLGKWMDSNSSNTPAFLAIKKPHELVHSSAREALEAHKAGNIQEEEKAFAKLRQSSKEVILYLEELQK